MPTVISKPPVQPSKYQTKLCLKCGRVRSLKEFYANRDWSEQLGKDAWCKFCVTHCETKDDIRRYFWENHRKWNEHIWDVAKDRAIKRCATNPTFQKASTQRRELMLEKLTAQNIPAVMANFYEYFDPTKDSDSLSYDEAKENGEIVQEHDPNEKSYSPMFNGSFKPSELEYLESYYNNLGGDDLDTENLRDYVKKLAKASLQADKAQDDYASGKCDFSVVKDALSLFDMLSKSSNLAACKNKPKDDTGKTSWSEVTAYLETNGHPCVRKIQWEKDDVDRTIDEFSHLVTALGLNER